MKKVIENIVAINVVSWYQKEDTQTKLKSIPLKTQWVLLKNMKKIEPIAENFNKFRNDLNAQRNAAWFTEGNDKCERVTNENNQEVLQVKEEYLEEFYKYDEELNNQIKEIIEEEVEIEYTPINFEDLLNSDDIELNIVDLDMLSVFEEEEEEEETLE